MPVTVEIEKRPLGNFQPSKYCEWCVTIKTDNPAGFQPHQGFQPNPANPLQSFEWALDFPADTDILDPKKAAKIKGAPKYKIDPDYGKGTTTPIGAKEVKICFVAACKERDDVEMSVERRNIFPVPPLLVDPDELWEPVPHEGGEDGVGPIVGPAAVASAAPVQEAEPFGILASFEAAKLGALLGVDRPIGYPRPDGPQIMASRAATKRIYVSNLAEEPEEKPKRKSSSKKK